MGAVSEESYPKMLLGLNESPWTIINLGGFNGSEFPWSFGIISVHESGRLFYIRKQNLRNHDLQMTFSWNCTINFTFFNIPIITYNLCEMCQWKLWWKESYFFSYWDFFVLTLNVNLLPEFAKNAIYSKSKITW